MIIILIAVQILIFGYNFDGRVRKHSFSCMLMPIQTSLLLVHMILLLHVELFAVEKCCPFIVDVNPVVLTKLKYFGQYITTGMSTQKWSDHYLKTWNCGVSFIWNEVGKCVEQSNAILCLSNLPARFKLWWSKWKKNTPSESVSRIWQCTMMHKLKPSKAWSTILSWKKDNVYIFVIDRFFGMESYQSDMFVLSNIMQS